MSFSEKLSRDHFLSQMEPRVIPKVKSINKQLFSDLRIINLFGSLYKFSRSTFDHLFNTQITACYMCIVDALDQANTERIMISALLHDVGKLLIPSNILSKQGKLSDLEWNVMRNHPLYSAKLLESLGLSEEILAMVQYHHIHYNGTGYPSTPSEWKSQESYHRSLSFLVMADAFDAMYHERTYRPTYHLSQIYEEIATCVSQQFAPRPATIMLGALLNMTKEEAILCQMR